MIDLPINRLKRVIDRIDRNTYQSIKKAINRSINPYAYIYLKDIDTSHYRYTSNYNRRGEFVILGYNNQPYCKFMIPVNITGTTDRYRNSSVKQTTVFNMLDRGLYNISALLVYANRKKVADARVYITIYQGGFDIYVPLDCFDTNSSTNELTLLYNRFKHNRCYYSQYITGSVTDTIEAEYDTSRYDIRLETLEVYRNGQLLYPGIDYSYETPASNRYRVVLDTALAETDELEIVYNPDVKHMQLLTTESDITGLIRLPGSIGLDNYLISEQATELYVNGYRYFPEDMTALTPYHLRVTDYTDGNWLIKFKYNEQYSILNDTNRYEDRFTRFYRIRRIPNDIETILMSGDTLHEYPYPEWFDELNRPLYYPPEYYKYRDTNPLKQGKSYRELLIDTIKSYLAMNPEYYRYLFEEFANHPVHTFSYSNVSDHMRTDTLPELANIYETTFTNPMLLHVFDLPDDNAPRHRVVVTVTKPDGEYKFYDSEVFFYEFNHKGYLYIDTTNLTVEDNEPVHIRVLRIYNDKQYELLDLDTTEKLNQATYTFELDRFGYIRRNDDIYVMKRVDDTVPMSGWQKLEYNTDYTVDIDTDNNELTISISTGLKALDNRFIIYNCSFSGYRSFSFTDPDYMNRRIYEYDQPSLVHDNFDPMNSRYGLLVYVDRKRWFYSLDYFVSGQDSHNEIYQSLIHFKRIPPENQLIEIYTIEERDTDYAYCGHRLDTPYNVFYFPHCSYSLNERYIRVYANGSLRDDYMLIGPNILYFHTSDWIYECYVSIDLDSEIQTPDDIDEFWPLQEPNLVDTEDNNPVSSYDLFLPIYNSSGVWQPIKYLEDYLDPIVAIPPVSYEPPSRHIPFLHYVATKLRAGTLPHYMNANELIPEDFSKPEYRELMTPEELVMDEVRLDANKYQILYEDCVIDCEGTLIPVLEVIDIVGDALYSGELDFTYYDQDTGRFTNYADLDIYWKLYEEELKLFNTDTELNPALPDVIVLDANYVEP